PAWNGRPEVRTPANNHRLPKRTLNNNLNIMPSHYRTVRLQQGLWEKNTTRRVEIFFPNRRSEPLQLSHPHACNFALCLSYFLSSFTKRILWMKFFWYHFNHLVVANFPN